MTDNKVKKDFTLLVALALVMFALQLINFITSGWVSGFGIVPRQLDALLYIPIAPFIHHNWSHFFANIIPFLLLSWLILRQGVRAYLFVTLLVTMVAGLAVWLFASLGYHAGASILVFGYWGYLISIAVFRRRLTDVVIAILVLAIYGGLFWSLFRLLPNVSWSSHFFGLLAGVLAAWLRRNIKESNI
ncbi:rhomboid family intramembrane serine protease [Salinibius halmophilus]|uniref:rhomboid family intramembrane serine protease n=1 Tax=Salinibius halmophilus TaxID=1853216 RepID=UPI000E66621F|nr:rhomboid family intramembrane serine protease [Salinibius halmophilus]